MKIAKSTKYAISKFLTNAFTVTKYKTDYSVSLLYNSKYFPAILGNTYVGDLEDKVRGLPLYTNRNLVRAQTVLKTLKESSKTELSFYSIDDKLRYFIGCGCIFSDKLDPILLSYYNRTDLFGNQLTDHIEKKIFINSLYVNNNNKLNNFISKKIIPAVTAWKCDVVILDESRMNSLVFKPTNSGTVKDLCWAMINHHVRNNQ